MKRPAVAAFLTCAIGSAMLTAAPLCWANHFARHGAMECIADDPDSVTLDDWEHAHLGAGSPLVLSCPYPDTDAFPEASSANITFYFYTPHAIAATQVWVGECTTYSTAAGGICGGAGNGTAVSSGAFQIASDASSWNAHANGFAFTYVGWTAAAATAGVTYAGFKVTDVP